MPKQSISALLKSLERNLWFHAIIENEIRQSPYGQHTYNVVLRDGIVQLDTINIVKSRRRRYKQKPATKLDKTKQSWYFSAKADSNDCNVKAPLGPVFMSDLTEQIKTRQDAAFKYLETKRALWDDCEDLFHNKLISSISKTTKSKVFDPALTTLVLERGYRVMAQLPTGKVRGISKNDSGASSLLNMIVDKYVIPNAKSQFDFLTKLRMTDIYSNLYGNFFVMVDWNVGNNGYIGPDMWLLNIRDVFPQVGAVSLEDSDFVIVRTWKPLSYFEAIAKDKGFKNIPEILDKLKETSGDKQSRDAADLSGRESDQYPEQVAAKEAGYFEVWTQFERDRWVDYCVKADLEFREIKNPHDNGELPVECKYSIPLLDDFMGMGDFERGKPMQMVTNSIWNLYLEAVKMSIFPPVMLNKDNIAAMSSIKWGAAEKWLVRGQVDNAARTIDLSPKGIRTFQGVYQVAKASLLNQFGTTDTSVTAQIEPGFGRTPKALQMQERRENARDTADRFYMEQFLKKVMRKMVNLIAKKQTGAVTMRLFEEDIKELAATNPDIAESYNPATGKLKIDKKTFGSTLWDYEIVSGSTYAIDEEAQQKNLVMLLEMIQNNPNLLPMIEKDFHFHFGELLKRVISKSGIQNWDRILEEKTEEEKKEAILQEHRQQFMAALQGQQGMNQVPPEQGPPVPQGQSYGPKQASA